MCFDLKCPQKYSDSITVHNPICVLLKKTDLHQVKLRYFALIIKLEMRQSDIHPPIFCYLTIHSLLGWQGMLESSLANGSPISKYALEL